MNDILIRQQDKILALDLKVVLDEAVIDIGAAWIVLIAVVTRVIALLAKLQEKPP